MKVDYTEPEVTSEDIDARIAQIRDGKSTFVNEEPRPLADGDFAVISLESIGGVDEPVKTDEVTIEIGGKDTFEGFTENLRGMSPEEEKVFRCGLPRRLRPGKAGRQDRVRFSLHRQRLAPQRTAGAKR